MMIEKLSRKWWFYVIILLMQMLPPFSSEGYDISHWGLVITETLQNSFQVKMKVLYIYAQLISIAMLVLLFVFRNRFAKPFTTYVMVSYIVFAVLQNMAFTPHYGFSAVTANVIMMLLVAWAWLTELCETKNDYSFGNLKWYHGWMIAASLIAFWVPVNSAGEFSFNPVYMLTRGSSLGFCMMTPVFLTIMCVNAPKINTGIYRITAFMGIIIGLYNMSAFSSPSGYVAGYLHLPLLVISVYCFVHSFLLKKHKQ